MFRFFLAFFRYSRTGTISPPYSSKIFCIFQYTLPQGSDSADLPCLDHHCFNTHSITECKGICNIYKYLIFIISYLRKMAISFYRGIPLLGISKAYCATDSLTDNLPFPAPVLHCALTYIPLCCYIPHYCSKP